MGGNLLMWKLLLVALMLVVTGCMPFVRQELTSYSFDGKEVTVGMNANNVRELAGPPTNISRPSALSNTLFPGGVYDNMTRGQQYWQYGSLKNGGKQQISITFSDGIVTGIDKFTDK